jgi:hypothetical protein
MPTNAVDLVRAVRTRLLGPESRWACLAVGGVLVTGGLVGFLIAGGH